MNMVLKKAADPDVAVWHHRLQKTFKGCEKWADSCQRERWEENYLDRIKQFLASGQQDARVWLDLRNLGHLYGTYACLAARKPSSPELSRLLHDAIACNSLAFRCEASVTLPSSRQPVMAFWSSMRAAGPIMVSQWGLAAVCAQLLIDVAHKDQAINSEGIREKAWGKGTNDAFLIYLLSQAFDIPTHYIPVHPLIPEYEGLLGAWRTEDEATFRNAMHAAAEFHISRNKDGTERNTYEFEKYFDRVYPGELLAIQALRRRDGLPEFVTGHLLVDTPWSILCDLAPSEPHLLTVQVEVRLRHDFPEFR
ncbi:MAG: hypothetical protein ACRDD3_09545 [Azovibrio sp.]